jgi:PAS domain-containing protein
MYRILGLIPQSVPPTSRLIHTGDDQYYVTKMKEASHTHQLYAACPPNGEERIVLESGQPKFDSQQKLVSIIGTLLDITEERRAERVLRKVRIVFAPWPMALRS